MQSRLECYFDRIGYEGPVEATLAVLRKLHFLHPKSIPFENLDQVMGEHCFLDTDWIFEKMVMQKRGGWCYEHGFLFGSILEEIGFDVNYHLCRIMWHRPANPEARLHAALTVDTDEGRYLCDVGYGRFTATAPISLETQDMQITPHEPYRVRISNESIIIEMQIGAEWRAVYELDDRPLVSADFEICDHYLRTHPSSLFLNSIVAVGVTDESRLSLRNEDFTIRQKNGEENRETVTSESLPAILSSRFGIDLSKVDKDKLCSTFDRLAGKR